MNYCVYDNDNKLEVLSKQQYIDKLLNNDAIPSVKLVGNNKVLNEMVEARWKKLDLFQYRGDAEKHKIEETIDNLTNLKNNLCKDGDETLGTGIMDLIKQLISLRKSINKKNYPEWYI